MRLSPNHEVLLRGNDTHTNMDGGTLQSMIEEVEPGDIIDVTTGELGVGSSLERMIEEEGTVDTEGGDTITLLIVRCNEEIEGECIGYSPTGDKHALTPVDVIGESQAVLNDLERGVISRVDDVEIVSSGAYDRPTEKIAQEIRGIEQGDRVEVDLRFPVFDDDDHPALQELDNEIIKSYRGEVLFSREWGEVPKKGRHEVVVDPERLGVEQISVQAEVYREEWDNVEAVVQGLDLEWAKPYAIRTI